MDKLKIPTEKREVEKAEESIVPEETMKTNPKLFLKTICTQTIKVEVNEYFEPRDLVVLACLCK